MCIITITRGSRFGGRGDSLWGRDSWGGDDNRRGRSSGGGGSSWSHGGGSRSCSNDWLIRGGNDRRPSSSRAPSRESWVFLWASNKSMLKSVHFPYWSDWLMYVRKTWILEVLASIVGVQDTWQQIVLTREGSNMFLFNGFCSWERDILVLFGVINANPFVLVAITEDVCFRQGLTISIVQKKNRGRKWAREIASETRENW